MLQCVSVCRSVCVSVSGYVMTRQTECCACNGMYMVMSRHGEQNASGICDCGGTVGLGQFLFLFQPFSERNF